MKRFTQALLGVPAGILVVSGAQAADLPTRKAAPVQYVKICDAYGAGFFYIPGTDTCLRVGGQVVAQMRIQGANNMYSISGHLSGAVPAGGLRPSLGSYRTGNGFTRDSVGYDATARVELDARTQTGFGTLRSFIRLQSTFGSGLNSTTGSYAGLQPAFAVGGWNGVGATTGKEFTYLDKAFIQFAGLTMGRTQSFFDFYTDNFSYENLRGSNQNVWALAYTATFGGGFSATLSVEDTQSHRGEVGNTVFNTGLGGAFAAATLGATAAAGRLPDIIASLRVDQSWGAAQLAGALHPVRAALYASVLNPGAPLSLTSTFGYALSAGLKFNLDSIAKGDQLWLQAIYAKGAVGYTAGSNMSFTASPNLTQNYGRGTGRIGNSYGWNGGTDFDCVYTMSGACDLSTSYAVTAAFKHYWAPGLSSALFGSYYRVSYSNAALTPVGWTGAFGGGVSNYAETRVGTNVIWTPVKGFDIGGEFTWVRAATSRPFGLANDLTLVAAGFPAFRSVTNGYYGKIRMTRAF